MWLNVAWMRVRVLLSAQFLLLFFLVLYSVSVFSEEVYEYSVVVYTPFIEPNPTPVSLGTFRSKGEAIAAMRAYNDVTGHLSYAKTQVLGDGTQIDRYEMLPQPAILGAWVYYPSGYTSVIGEPFSSEGQAVEYKLDLLVGNPHICRVENLTSVDSFNVDTYYLGPTIQPRQLTCSTYLLGHGLNQHRKYEFTQFASFWDGTIDDWSCENPTEWDSYFIMCRQRPHICPDYAPVNGDEYAGSVFVKAWCGNWTAYAKIFSTLKSNPCPKTVGNPCSPETGNKLETETDFDQGGLSFSRYYQSGPMLTLQGEMGNNWSHTYSARIFEATYSTVHVSNAKGQFEWFVHLNGGTYVSYRVDGKLLHKETDAEGQIHWSLVSRSGIQRFLQKSDSEDGLLVEIEDSNGKVTQLSYDENNRLSQVIGPFNRTLQLGYNTDGLLATVTAPDGQDYQYTYDSYLSGQDPQWRLGSVIYPDNTTRNYLYEDTRHPNHLTGIMNEKAVRYGTYGYDDLGRVISSEHTGGQDSIQLTYHSDRTVVTDALGKQTTYYLTQLGPYKTVERVEENGNSTTYTRDSYGWVNQITDNNGNVTQYERNARGLITRKVEAVGTPESRETITEWHPEFAKATKITVQRKQTINTHDGDGRLLSSQENPTQP